MNIGIKKRLQNRQRLLAGIGLAILVVFAVCLALIALPALTKTGGLAMAVPMLGMAAAGALEEKEFQDTVISGVELLKKNHTNLTGEFSRLDGETKKAFEELTSIKTATNTSHMEIMQKLAKVDAQLRREHRMAFGDPIKRIQSDVELRMNLNAVFRAVYSQDNGTPLPEIFKEHLKDFGKIQQRAVGEDTTPGSTYLRTELLQEIYDTLARYGKWNTLGVRRMGTKLTNMPIKTARPKAQWILTEAGPISDDTNVAGTTVQLQVYLAAVLLNVSRQILDDSMFDVTPIVLDDFMEAVNLLLDTTMFSGNGVGDGDNGSQTGLFNYGTSAVAAAGNTTVSGIQLDDFVNCLTTVDPVVLARQAKWWIHPTLLAKIVLIRDRNGRPIFQNALEAPTPAGIGSILGYPVELVFGCPSTDAPGAKIAAFGDPNGYVVGMREDFGFEASDHFRWNTFERSFRGIVRAGGKGRRASAFAILTTAAA